MGYDSYMEPQILAKLEAIEARLIKVESAVEKTRRYLQIIVWVTVAMVVLPILGLLFAVPLFISSYVSALGGI